MAVGGNLIDQVPVLHCMFDDGSTQELPVSAALRWSHRIVDLVWEVPTMQPAVLRQLLLPIFVDALGSPPTLPDWERRFKRGHLDDSEQGRLATYFEKWSHRFDLFHPERPFAQVADLHTDKKATKVAALLVATEPTGNNVPLFGSRAEADALALTVDAAARWLMHTHCWDVGAIKTGAVGDPESKGGKTSGNPKGPLGELGVVLPVGTTLYETLLLNTQVGVQDRLGTPQWRRDRDDPSWAGGPKWSAAYIPDGLLDVWTLQSRRIRLFATEIDGATVIDRVIVAAGDRLRGGPPEWEPHTFWELNEKTKKTSNPRPKQPLRHVPGQAVWQGIQALLALEADASKVCTSELIDQVRALEKSGLLQASYPLRVQITGIEYGSKSAVIEDLIHDMIPLPIAALRSRGAAYDVVVEAAAQAERLAAALNRLSADLRHAVGATPVPWGKGQCPGDQLLYSLDPLIRRLLAGVHADADDAEKLEAGQLAWETLAHRATWRTAEPLFDLPASAFSGRIVTDKKTEKQYSYKLGLAAHTFAGALRRILPYAADPQAGTRTARQKTQGDDTAILEPVRR